MSTLRIGISDSHISRIAAEGIRDQLAEVHEDHDFELVAYQAETRYSPLDPEAYVRALEAPLVKGKVDMVVHQLKEIPVRLPAAIHLVGVTERLTPFDAFVSERFQLIDELTDGHHLGYSHPRQKSQLLIQYPDLDLVELHGSADSRLQQLGSQDLDGLIISAEDLELVGKQNLASEVLGENMILPSPGSGCLGFLVQREDEATAELLRSAVDNTSRQETIAERAFLDNLGGNPEIALGVHAALDSQSMIVEGFLGTPEGDIYIRDAIQGPPDKAELLGANLAKLLLTLGDDNLLGLVAAAS